MDTGLRAEAAEMKPPSRYYFLQSNHVTLHNNQLNYHREENMKNTTFIKYDKAAGRQSLFFGDAQADFYVLFAGKLYFLRKQFLSSSSYFCRKILKKHRVHVIDSGFKSSSFQKILSCFYGLKCIFERGKEAEQIMEVIKFLECKDLQELLRKQMLKNFNEYELFFLLDFANKYHDNQLQFVCQQELIKQNFQQFNFNRFQLLKSKEDVFKSLIRLHQKLKTARVITGLTFQDIRKLILEYNAANSTSVDLLAILIPPPSSIIIEDPEGEKQSPLPESLNKIKKRQTVNLNNSYGTQYYECPALIQLVQLESCLSQSCRIDKKNCKKKLEPEISQKKEQKKIREDQKNTLIESQQQTEPQESLQNSERTIQAINEALKVDSVLNLRENKPKINMFLKKRRSGSTNFAESVNLLNYSQFYNENPQMQRQGQEEMERVIKSQRIEKSGKRYA